MPILTNLRHFLAASIRVGLPLQNGYTRNILHGTPGNTEEEMTSYVTSINQSDITNYMSAQCS